MGSDADNPDEKKPSAVGSADGALLWIARDGPMWARVPAIIGLILIATVPSVLLVVDSVGKWKPSNAEKPAATQLDLTAVGDLTSHKNAVKALLDKPNLGPDEKKHLSDEFEEMEHRIWHLSNPSDNVPWITFAKKTSKDYFGFKLFPSDRCLVVARIEDGKASSEWLRDPNSAPLPPPDTTHPAPTPAAFPSKSTHASETSELSVPGDVALLQVSSSRDDLELHLATDQSFQLPDNPAGLRRVQMGSCLAQHPGNFQSWWGPPINQCQQPMFRRWADGCAHTQVYDRCQNVWGPVVWQYCAVNHYW